MLIYYILRSIINVLPIFTFLILNSRMFFGDCFIILFNFLFNLLSMIFNGHDFLRKDQYRRLEVPIAQFHHITR